MECTGRSTLHKATVWGVCARVGGAACQSRVHMRTTRLVLSTEWRRQAHTPQADHQCVSSYSSGTCLEHSVNGFNQVRDFGGVCAGKIDCSCNLSERPSRKIGFSLRSDRNFLCVEMPFSEKCTPLGAKDCALGKIFSTLTSRIPLWQSCSFSWMQAQHFFER